MNPPTPGNDDGDLPGIHLLSSVDIRALPAYDFLNMRTLHLPVLVLAILAFPLASRAEDHPSGYGPLLAALKAGDTHIDYARLRLSYVDSSKHKKAKDTTAQQKQMFSALQARDFAEALKKADQILDSEYIDLDAHFAAYIASRELGDSAKADFHKAVFRGLVDSIRDSGDGKSPEKAWVIVSVHEEYVVLRVLGYKPSQQSLLQKNGHFYDVMKVNRIEDGSDATFYFNTDIPMKEGKF